jgi:hypothetical protein
MVNIFRSVSGGLFVLGLDDVGVRPVAPTAVVNLTDNYRSALQFDTSTNHVSLRDAGREWLELDLGGNFAISSVNLQNHADQDLNGATITLFDEFGDQIYTFPPITDAVPGQLLVLTPPSAFNAHSVRIDSAFNHDLELAGIDVFGSGQPDNASNVGLTENEFAELQGQVSSLLADFADDGTLEFGQSGEVTMGNALLPDDGAGADHFVFNISGNPNIDVIDDFQPGDKIDVSSLMSDGPTTLVNGHAGQGEVGYTFEQVNGEEFTVLRGNLDSDANEEFTVYIKGHHNLTGADIA